MRSSLYFFLEDARALFLCTPTRKNHTKKRVFSYASRFVRFLAASRAPSRTVSTSAVVMDAGVAVTVADDEVVVVVVGEVVGAVVPSTRRICCFR